MDGFGRSLRPGQAGHQPRKRNGISGGERDNALPQWSLGERHAHELVSSQPVHRLKEQPIRKEIRAPAENYLVCASLGRRVQPEIDQVTHVRFGSKADMTL